MTDGKDYKRLQFNLAWALIKAMPSCRVFNGVDTFDEALTLANDIMREISDDTMEGIDRLLFLVHEDNKADNIYDYITDQL